MKSFVALLIACAAPTAFACGYDPCAESAGCPAVPRLDLDPWCSADRPFLDAHNDTRGNLALLFAQATGQTYDTRPAAEPYNAEAEKLAASVQKDQYNAKLAAVLPAGQTLPAFPEHMNERYWEAENPCRTNDLETAGGFYEGLAKANIASESKSAVALARHKMLAVCTGGSQGPDIAALTTELGQLASIEDRKEHANYLLAALLLYTGKAADAETKWHDLAETARDPWLKEASLYLEGRAGLVASQGLWNGYDPPKIDSARVDAAEKAFKAYVAKYPNGPYAKSAIATDRKIARLRGDLPLLRKSLWTAFDAALAQKLSAKDARVLVNEIDRYALSGSTAPVDSNNPLVLVTELLYFARDPKVTRARLEDVAKAVDAQKAAFDPYPGLYAYAQARAALSLGDADKALASLSGARAKAAGMLATSLALVEAEAWEAKGSFAEARVLWKEQAQAEADLGDLIRRPLQTGLARNYVLAGNLVEGLATGSGVTEPWLQSEMVERLASEAELRRIAAATDIGPLLRDKATSILLARLLLREQYAEFTKLYDASSPAARQSAESVATAARALAADTTDAKGRMNLGYYLATAEIVSHLTHCTNPLSMAGQIATSVKNFEVKSYYDFAPPLDHYLSALSRLEKKPDGDLEAKVLFHAIMCFKNGENSGRCQWTKNYADIGEPTRAAWFKRLKAKYPKSKWAKELKYYY